MLGSNHEWLALHEGRRSTVQEPMPAPPANARGGKRGPQRRDGTALPAAGVDVQYLDRAGEPFSYYGAKLYRDQVLAKKQIPRA